MRREECCDIGFGGGGCLGPQSLHAPHRPSRAVFPTFNSMLGAFAAPPCTSWASRIRARLDWAQKPLQGVGHDDPPDLRGERVRERGEALEFGFDVGALAGNVIVYKMASMLFNTI
jgi:hypothetical protein